MNLLETSKSLSVANVEKRCLFMYRILLFLETILEICVLEMSITVQHPTNQRTVNCVKPSYARCMLVNGKISIQWGLITQQWNFHHLESLKCLKRKVNSPMLVAHTRTQIRIFHNLSDNLPRGLLHDGCGTRSLQQSCTLH